jgi:hypothetical protein
VTYTRCLSALFRRAPSGAVWERKKKGFWKLRDAGAMKYLLPPVR